MHTLKHSVPKKVLLIGASTGGPTHIQSIISSLKKLNNVSVVIAQHMAKGFIPSFVKRLHSSTLHNTILLAKNGEVFQNNTIYLCCGDTQLIQNAHGFTFTQTMAKEHTFNPDINMIFHSFLSFTPQFEIMCIILTGIGDDGVDACNSLAKKGAITITQTSKDAVVDGMPARARERVQGIKALPFEEILQEIQRFCDV